MFKNFPFPLPWLLPGGSVSNLEARGMPPGSCAEQWAAQHPEILAQLQQEWIHAGAQALCAPTYGANAAVLAEFGLEDEVSSLNLSLMQQTKSAASAAGLPAGGRIGPSGLFVPPFGTSDFDDIYTLYRRQIRALEEGGADFLLVEDQNSLADMRAALLAARATDLPVFVTLSVDASGHTLTGGAFLPALITLQAMEAQGVGLSCGSAEWMPEILADAVPHALVPLMVKPDADLTPEAFGENLLQMARCGASIFGGCCGATPAHIHEAARRLEANTLVFHNPSPDPKPIQAAATEKECFFLGSDLSLSPLMECSPSLEEDLIQLEESQSNVALIQVETLDDALLLAEAGAEAKMPIAVRCHSLPVLDAALRYFQGRLLIDSDCPLEPEELEPLAVKYGAILY